MKRPKEVAMSATEATSTTGLSYDVFVNDPPPRDGDKGGRLVEDLGPGNDWRCVVTWRLPGATATGSAIYQLDVNPDGRYIADGDGPQEVNGFFQVHTSTGDAPNPLWQFDGTVDLSTPISPR